jgi:hypothetical protein
MTFITKSVTQELPRPEDFSGDAVSGALPFITAAKLGFRLAFLMDAINTEGGVDDFDREVLIAQERTNVLRAYDELPQSMQWTTTK